MIPALLTADLDPELVQRFWARVEISAGCWRWTGHVSTNGYGRFTFRGRSYAAHRLALAISGVDVPADLDACHTCDTRWCVNPAHLYVGTRTENMADCTERARHNKPRGQAHWRAKLDDQAVREIRALVAAGMSQTAAASRFGVRSSTVSRIVRRVWRQEVA